MRRVSDGHCRSSPYFVANELINSTKGDDNNSDMI